MPQSLSSFSAARPACCAPAWAPQWPLTLPPLHLRPTEFELEAALRKARQGKTQQRQQRTVHSILEQLQALAYRQAALEGRGGAGDGFGLASRGSVAQVPQALPSGDTLEGGGIAAARLLSLSRTSMH